MKDQLETNEAAELTTTQGMRDAALPAANIGRLAELNPQAGPMVDFPLNNSGRLLHARTLVPLEEAQVGLEVALVFEDGEVTRPIILGVMQEWNAPRPHRLEETEPEARVQVRHGEESLLLTAAKEITLQCGKSSITLTSAGKLLLRGAYLLSRSSGVNRIKGGSVQIN